MIYFLPLSPSTRVYRQQRSTDFRVLRQRSTACVFLLRERLFIYFFLCRSWRRCRSWRYIIYILRYVLFDRVFYRFRWWDFIFEWSPLSVFLKMYNSLLIPYSQNARGYIRWREIPSPREGIPAVFLYRGQSYQRKRGQYCTLYRARIYPIYHHYKKQSFLLKRAIAHYLYPFLYKTQYSYYSEYKTQNSTDLIQPQTKIIIENIFSISTEKFTEK